MSTQALSASLEDYVEAIFHIAREKQSVRAKDIADRMHVTRPSVSGALQSLAREGLVDHEPYDVITLTSAGRSAARDVVRRHEVLRDFFVSVLGIEAEEAETAACAVEHGVSRKIVDRVASLVGHVKRDAGGTPVWLSAETGEG